MAEEQTMGQQLMGQERYFGREAHREYGGYEGGGYFARGRYAEHSWRGGMFGWMGAGIRAAASWFGDRLQGFGRRLGGTLSEAGTGLGETLRGRGERMGFALEERAAARAGGPMRGRPPRSYHRPDERILEEVYERIARSGADAEDVEAQVQNGVVTLQGKVPSRADRRIIEDVAEGIFGVQEIHDQLRIARMVPRAEREELRAEPRGNGQAVQTEHRPQA
jgi:hypothetical protein